MYQALNAHKIMKQMLCDSSKRDHNEVARSGRVGDVRLGVARVVQVVSI